MKSILAKGKTENKNRKFEHYINYIVLIGFGFMLFWILYLYPIATYLLIMIPTRNFLVATFLGTNILLKEERTKTIYVKPKNIYEKKHSVKSAEIKFNNISKSLNFGKISIKELESKKVKIDLSKGFFGYFIIVKRELI